MSRARDKDGKLNNGIGGGWNPGDSSLNVEVSFFSRGWNRYYFIRT